MNHKCVFLCAGIFGWVPAFFNMKKANSMNITREQLKLYAVTDRSWLGSETLYEQVEKALKRRRDLSAASGENS